MSIIKEQQQALDNVLVPRERRLTIGSCNYRLSTTFKPKEPTFQVALDVLSLTPFYPAFLITASVPTVYMHEFWATVTYQKHHIRFRMNKKSYSFDLDTFRNMLQMCPKLPGQKFVDPPFEEEILTFMRELGYSGNIKLLSDVKHEVVQKYGDILPDNLTTQVMKESEAYKAYYAFSTGKAIPKPKYMKLAIERSKTQLHSSQPSGSGAHEGTGITLGVPDVPIYGSDKEQISWKSSDEEDDDDDEANIGKDEDDNDHDDDERTESDNDGDYFVHSKLSTHDDEARKDDEVNEEESNKESNEESDKEVQGANTEEEEMDKEATHEEDEANELYRDVNFNLEGRDTMMTDAPLPNVQATQETKDTHVIPTAPINPKGQQQSSSMSSGFISNMLNPRPDTCIDLIFTLNTEATSLIDVLVTTIAEPPLVSVTTLPPPPTPLITHFQQTPVSTPTTIPSTSLQDHPNFGSLFGFDHRHKTLETDFSEFKQTNQFVEAVSSIPGIVDAYLANKMHEAVKIKIIKDQVKEQVKAQVSKILPKNEKTVNEQLKDEVMTHSSTESKTSLAIASNLSELELKKILIDKMETNKSIHKSNEQKNLYKALVEAYKSYKLIFDTYGDTVSFKRRRDDEDKDKEPSARSNQGSKRRRAGKEPESTSTPKEKTPKSTGKSTERSKSLYKSAGESAHSKDPMHTTKDLEEPAHQEFETRATKDQIVDETPQPSECNLAWEEGPRESFDELMDTPLDFSAFMMNRLKADTLTPELLVGLTFELMKGTCKSLVELKYFFEEVYKATTDQLDWNNPEGQQYPHDMQKPLPLIPNSRGCQVIPFDHFINNNVAYLSGGVSSRTYATFVTKTKAVDYGHIKWIKDSIPNTMWSEVPESAHDVSYKHRIIVVTKLQIVKWHGYKHLDWITVHGDDDKLYTFKEGDFKRLHLSHPAKAETRGIT
ncbi:hypothetical protein Tco_0194659 [Tanacetum coccineum]